MEHAVYYSHKYSYTKSERINAMLRYLKEDQANKLNKELLKENKKSILKKVIKVFKFIKDNF